jgi:hypothetical protein
MTSPLNGIRDVDSPCSLYEETDYPISVVNDCEGDGHYMCRDCTRLTNAKHREFALDGMNPQDLFFIGLNADGSDPQRWRRTGRF